MPTLDVARRHPEYEVWQRRVDFLWRSYIGGEEYDPERFLVRHPRETNELFAARAERTPLLNYYAAVIDAYMSAVYKRDPVREPDNEETTEVGHLEGVLDEFQYDATGDGTSLTAFVRDAMTFALAAQRAFVVVDVDENQKPYCHQLHPDNLLDFDKDRSGNYLWALVAEKVVIADDPFKDRVEEQRFRLWLPDEYMLFDKDSTLLEQEANPAGRVPIADITSGDINLPVYDIAKINQYIYNLGSQLGEIFNNVTFPMPYFVGDSIEDETGAQISDDVSPIKMGSAKAVMLPPDSSVVPGYLAPPDGPAKLHMEERERLVDSIYSLAGLQRKDPDSIKAQSGAAKAYDFIETNQRMVTLAQASERAELAIFELLDAYGFGANVNVSYAKDFNVRDFQVELDNYLKIQEAILPVEVKKRAATEVTMAIAEEATEEDKRALREAVDNMTDADFAPQEDPIARALGPRTLPELNGGS